jgi:hypothetical protein
MIELEKANHPIGGFGQSRIRGAEQAGHHIALVFLPGEDQIFAHRQFWKNLKQLECAADAEAVQRGRAQSGDDLAVDLYLTAARRQLAENAVEESRLAATVRSDQPENFALVNLEAYAIDGRDAAKMFADVVDFEDRGHGAVSGPDFALARSADAVLVRRSARKRSRMPRMPVGE